MHTSLLPKKAHLRRAVLEAFDSSPRTSVHKQILGQQRCHVQNNAGMYNPVIFVSEAHCRHGCENNDTERANFKSQYCERNVSRSRHMAVRSACKFIDREQMSVQELIVLKLLLHTILDGHHHNWLNFVLARNKSFGLSFTIKLFDTQNKWDNDCEKCPKLKIIGNLENTSLQKNCFHQ